MNKECYQELKERMEEIRDIGDLRYLYTAKRNDEGTLVYVVGGPLKMPMISGIREMRSNRKYNRSGNVH